jgi:hypothetical protein
MAKWSVDTKSDGADCTIEGDDPLALCGRSVHVMGAGEKRRGG